MQNEDFFKEFTRISEDGILPDGDHVNLSTKMWMRDVVQKLKESPKFKIGVDKPSKIIREIAMQIKDSGTFISATDITLNAVITYLDLRTNNKEPNIRTDLVNPPKPWPSPKE